MDMRILIAEDDHDMRTVLTSTVRSMGHETRAFKSGNESISEMAIHPNEYGCALLDFNMEGLDGISTADILKRISKGLPVIMISGDFHAEQKAKEESVKIDCFIKKPFSTEELRNAITSCCELENSKSREDRT